MRTLPIAVIRGESHLSNEPVQPCNYQCPWRVGTHRFLHRRLKAASRARDSQAGRVYPQPTPEAESWVTHEAVG